MSEKIIDLEDVMERVQDDQELFLELLDIFEEDFKAKRVELGILLDKQDWGQIRDIAHSIKGASGNISAHLLQGVCARLEKSAEEGAGDEIVGMIPQLDEKFEELQKHIVELKQNFGG